MSDSLDTSIIVHCIMNDVPEQRALTLALLHTPNATHHIADMALAETIYVLEEHYYLTREDATERLSLFLARFSDCLNYNNNLMNKVFPFYLAHPKLSFYDCCLSVYAELNNAEPLFTFDKALARQSSNAKRLE